MPSSVRLMYSFPQGGMVKKEVVPGFKFKSLFRACTVTHLAPGGASFHLSESARGTS